MSSFSCFPRKGLVSGVQGRQAVHSSCVNHLLRDPVLAPKCNDLEQQRFVILQFLRVKSPSMVCLGDSGSRSPEMAATLSGEALVINSLKKA